jgi:subtilisin family serine protease
MQTNSIISLLKEQNVEKVPVLLLTSSRQKLVDAMVALSAHVLSRSDVITTGDLARRWIMTDIEGIRLLEKLKAKGEIIDYKVKIRPEVPDIKRLFGEAGESKPEPTMPAVRDLIGASTVNEILGYTGINVRIAVIDTGVDYSNPDLQDSLEYIEWTDDGNNYREPLVLDADETQVLTFTDVSDMDSDGYIDDMVITTYTYIPFAIELTYSGPVYIDGIPTTTGIYKFGIIYEWELGIELPILLTDPLVGGNYTIAIIDWNDNGNFTDEFLDGNYYTYDGNRITYWDNPEYGIPGDYDSFDLSVGVLGGFFYDWWWNFGYPSYIYPGWDLNGSWLSIFYDFYSHGTECAGVIASKGTWSGLPGIAPNSTIVGIKGLAWGMVEPGMLWAAGFDISPYGEFYYTGERRADIISNSWGISTMTYDYFGFGYDFESMFENALITPGYLDPTFPGVIIVHAAGNGGFGYGTVTSPGTASGVITVGASTSLSTSFDIYYYYEVPGYMATDGSADEVISWSARGPTPVGEVKPDVVNVGAWGWTVAPFFYDGYDLFGGTSMATPLTAGVIALMLDATDKQIDDPDLIKTLLQSTSEDLGYSPTIQSAGRINALKAVLAAEAMIQPIGYPEELQIPSGPIFKISTSTTGERLSEILSQAWYWNWGYNIPDYFMYWFGNFILPSPNIPSNFLDEAHSIFLGRLAKRRRTSFEITITNLNPGQALLTNIRALDYNFLGSMERDVIINGEEMYTYVTIDRSWFENAELVRFFLTVPFKYFDSNLDYNYDDRYRLWVFAWSDSDGSGDVTSGDDLVLLNYGYPTGTTIEVPIGNILQDVPEGWDVAVLINSAYGTFNTVAKLTIYKYGRVTDNNISFAPTSGTINPGSSLTVRGSLRVSGRATPGFYERFIELELQVQEPARGTLTTIKKYIPLSYTVYGNLRREIKLTSAESTALYDLGGLRGAFDWRWRQEAGDWRVYYVNARASKTFSIFVDFSWTQPNSSLIIYVIGPDGQFAGNFLGSGVSKYEHIDDGIFKIMYTGSEPTGGRRMITFASTSYIIEQYPYKLQRRIGGIYTILIHQISHGGLTPTDKISGKVTLFKSPTRLRDQMRVRTDILLRFRTGVRFYRTEEFRVAVSGDSPEFNTNSVIIYSGNLNTLIGPTLDSTIPEWSTTRSYRPGSLISNARTMIRFIIPSDPGTYVGAVLFGVSLPSFKTFYHSGTQILEYSGPTYWFQDWAWIRAR